MCEIHSACHFHNKFHRAPDRHGFAPDHFIELAAFNELHAEITLTIALADLMNGNNPWMFQTGGSFRFPAKALQMRFRGPSPHCNYLERNRAIETFLSRPINYPLTAPSTFFQQLVIA